MDVLLPLGTSIIAITGGQTMVRVSEGFTKDISVNRDLTIVPARGGMFGSMLIQANNVSEKMATGIGAHHEALFVSRTCPTGDICTPLCKSLSCKDDRPHEKGGVFVI